MKINDKNISKFSDLYIKQNKTINYISKNSLKIFNFYVSSDTVCRSFKRLGIQLRDKRKSISLGRMRLSPNKIMTNDIRKWVDGFLLGDGSIHFNKNRIQNGKTYGAKFTIGSSNKEWVRFAMSRFKDYYPCRIKLVKKSNNGFYTNNDSWVCYTLNHPDIVQEMERWYPSSNNYKKKIPFDINITSESVLLWYLGDGSINVTKRDEKGGSTDLSLATNGFDYGDIVDILIPKLKDLGIIARTSKAKISILGKQQYVMRISSRSIKRFFDLIGHCSPVKGYEYKFNYLTHLNYLKPIDVVEIIKKEFNLSAIQIRNVINYLARKNKMWYKEYNGERRILIDIADFENVLNKVRYFLKNNAYSARPTFIL